MHNEFAHEPDTPLADITMQRTVQLLRQPVYFDAEFEARVMRAVRADAEPLSVGTGGGGQGHGREMRDTRNERHVAERPWWKRTVTVRLGLPHTMAMAAGIALVVLGLQAGGDFGTRAVNNETITARTVATATPTATLMRFAVQVPEAQRVAIVGDFNAWDANATPLEWDADNGVWSAFLPLTPGRHEYMFVVDGREWVTDPLAVAERDEFGEASSVVRVPEPAATQSTARSGA